MFTEIRDANAQILEDNAQRRAAIDELATVPWKGAENRARRKAMKAAIDEMPAFRRITGPATRLHVKATLRAALNDAIGQQIITFNPGRSCRDRSGTQAEGAGVDGRAGRQVGADGREAVTRDGLDTPTDRRLP
ncbi:hypothetical protein GCM10009654_07550 [Streptomyces hebeiensis]|uniref:Transposase n=1 Tax=Streptomyces hebeiensis TaxID=229486 RepID=A0ABN1UK55_9ACTN